MYRTETIEEMDGARIEYEYVEPQVETLESLLRELFETHWSKIIFGPCIQGAKGCRILNRHLKRISEEFVEHRSH